MNVMWSKLSQREKCLLILAISGVVAVVFYQAVARPWWSKYQTLRQEHESVLTQYVALKGEVVAMTKARDPQILQQKIEHLTAQSTKLDDVLRQTLSGIASVNEMTHWLEAAMQQSSSLRLLSLETQASTPLSALPDNRYFVHPLTVTFKGKYWDIVAYLRRLEALPMKYHWQQLQYVVTDLPWANVTLTVSSVSTSPYWVSSEFQSVGKDHD